MSEHDIRESYDIAIIGMNGRFPGAPTLQTFWQNLSNSVEGITFFADDELRARGVPEEYLRHPNFVKASPVLENIDQFDASFFGYTPREAQLLDPQHRLFLECAWGALEDAGYNPQTFPGLIGVFAGTSLSTYLLFNVLTNPAFSDAEHSFEVMIGNDKDFLSTRVSYQLNLRGPSLDVQTGCSTSLVATHLACEALLSFQCDMALAGGVSVNVPQRTGYFYEEGGITSPDGHCRAFDAQAAGTLFGSGVGVVVLKRLTDALQDGDPVYAVIKGSAINNDGSRKIGFTAPGVDGQTEVITRALALADVEPETITYVETHGTATALGDPIEVSALTRAFRAQTDAKQFCAIGAVKSNIGHLDAAAGVAGLIKTVLSLYHRQLPPSLHFTQPNPKIEFADSPFYVNASLQPWQAGNTPRRAGVSSFGIGGTNAHVILEESPDEAAQPNSVARPWQLLLLSARSETALQTATADLATHLQDHPDLPLSAVSYTQQTGRKRFPYRRAIVCQDRADALEKLTKLPPQQVFTTYQEAKERPFVFMFPGGGAQYPHMGQGLYQQEPVFRQAVDQCLAILRRLGYHETFFTQSPSPNNQRFNNTSVALPILFTVEYALAQLLMAWGIRPSAMIGHSMGEYTAACLAGVFSLEDALAIVVKRGQLFEQLPEGGMLSLPLPTHELQPFLNGHLSLAAVNGPNQSVVAGPAEAIAALATKLESQEIEFRHLQINVAAHSAMVDLIVPQFTQFVEKLSLHPPQIPFVSNVTGAWITAEEATDPIYWSHHLRQTVRFGDGIAALLAEPGYAFVEVGPGHTLSTLARLQTPPARTQTIVQTMRHLHDKTDDNAFLLAAMGKLWAIGAEIEWQQVAGGNPGRTHLPTYPFERQRYWIEPGHKNGSAAGSRPTGKLPNITDWFYAPTWQRTPALAPLNKAGLTAEKRRWLIFDEGEYGLELAYQLQDANQEVVRVIVGRRFNNGRYYELRPSVRADYDALMRELHQKELLPDVVLHFWSLGGENNDFAQTQEHGLYSLIYLVQALTAYKIAHPVSLWCITNHLQQIESQDVINPAKWTLLSPCKIIPQEYEQITCYCVDVSAAHKEQWAAQLIKEVLSPPSEHVLAYRGSHRWVQTYTPYPVSADSEQPWPLRQNGVYLLTGGLGQIGLLLADYLSRTVNARLVLLGRSGLPEREQWQQYLLSHAESDETAQKIRKVQAIEARGGQVLVLAADVMNQGALQTAVSRAHSHFGALHGVIHAAGLAGEKTIKLLPDVDSQSCEQNFQAKVHGTYALRQALKGQSLDFVLLFSSNTSVLGGLGATAYAAANSFMDGFAVQESAVSGRWISATWDGWLTDETASLSKTFQTSIDQYAMRPEESVEAFRRVITAVTTPHIIISSGDLPGRLNLWINQSGNEPETPNAPLHPRPTLTTNYAPPEDERQELIAQVWAELLGIEQPGIHDNFFDLGGNSLIALKVISRLKKTLQREIPVVSLFEGPTIYALAELLGQDEGKQTGYDTSKDRGERRRQQHHRKTNQG